MRDADADQEVSTSQSASVPTSHQGGRRSPLAGWLLIAPAVVLLVWQQVVPAVRTVIGSFQDDPDGAWVGMANYQTALNQGLATDLLSGVGFGLLPAVLGFVAGFGTGRLFASAQGGLRRVGLILLAVALLWVAPSSLVLGSVIWIGVGQPALLIGLLTWLPAALVIGALVGAMMPAGARVRLAMTFGVLIAALAGAALGTQSLALAFTGSVPSPPAGRLYTLAFTVFDMGPAFAVGTVLLVVAIIAGVVVTRALLASGLRLRIAPRSAGQEQRSAGPEQRSAEPKQRSAEPEQPAPDQAPTGRAGSDDAPAGAGSNDAPAGVGSGDAPAGAGVMAVVAGAAILLVAVLASLPWLLEALRTESTVDVPWTRVWLGGGLEVLVAVVVAVLAGIGIGYLRPLGDQSLPLILTVLSPLLLVGLAPLLPPHFVDGFEQLATEPGALDSPYPQVVVVPLVFLAAYLADAWHRAAVQRGPREPGRVMAAALGLAAVALLILRSESSALRMLPDPAQQREVVIVAMQRLDVAAMVAQLKPWPVMLLLAVVGAVCAAGMGRLRIDVARPGHDRTAD